MAYLKMKLTENENGECYFTFSDDIADTIRETLKNQLDIPYLTRREESKGDRTTIFLNDIPEDVRDKFQKAAMKLFIQSTGKMHDN